MKKGFLLMIAVSAAMCSQAQSLQDLPQWSAELNVTGGSFQQMLSTVNLVSAYPNAVNGNISSIHPGSGTAMGGNLQIGYFIGKKRHFGISTGVMYTQQTYNLNMNMLSVEYQSTDFWGQTFRQVLSADGPIQEKITTTNINIPLLLKYQTNIGKKWGIMIEAGALFNIEARNAYTTNASFDYGAIYDLQQVDGRPVSVYDNAPTPNSSDWILTKAEYNATHNDGNAGPFLNTFKSQGYNVGLNEKPYSNSGTVPYETVSVGFMAQPSLTYNIGRNLFLNLGFFYAMQDLKNNASTSYMTTNQIGEYNSMLNGVKSSMQSTYGGTLGIRYFFNMKKRSAAKKTMTTAK